MAIEPIFQLTDFQIGTKFNSFQMLEQIGSGGQGVVWSALEAQHNRIVAIKFNEVASDSLSQLIDDLPFEHQIGSLADMKHPNILPTLDHGQFGQYQYLVSLYVPGGSLFDRIKIGPIYRREFLHIAAQISAGLSYSHKRGVIHRDLKPPNILIDNDQRLYITDFGLARAVSITTASVHTGRGTPPYAPPEQHSMTDISPQSDIYSFGIILYEMLTRRLPWSGQKTLGIQQLHTQDQLPDPRDIDPSLPPDLIQVLRLMTAAAPKDRPSSADEIMPMLDSAFENHLVPSPPIAHADSQIITNKDQLEAVGSSTASSELNSKLLSTGSR